MKLSKGDKAPQFSLFNSDKEKVELKDYQGKNVVLLFFPQAFTGVCTKEMCGMRDNYSQYEKLNAEIIGISVDSVFTLDQFKKAENLNFPLLSDFNKDTSRAYSSIYEHWILDMKGVSKRSAFVIDKDGIIQYAEVLENAGEEPDYDNINETLASIST